MEIINDNTLIEEKMPFLKAKASEYFKGKKVSFYCINYCDQIYFIAMSGKEGVLINSDGESFRFSESCLGGLYYIIKGDMTIYPAMDLDEEFGFVTKKSVTCSDSKGNQSTISVLPSSFEDTSFTSRVSFTQVNEEKDMMCEINYEYMGREKPLYPGYLNRLETVQLMKDYKKGAYIRPGFVPRRVEYYGKSIIDSNTLNYSFVSFDENGIINTLMNGAYELYNRAGYIVRFTKFNFMTPGHQLTELPWPFTSYKKEEDMMSMVKDYGFSTSIPGALLQAYNDQDKEIVLLQEFLSIIEKIKKNNNSIKSLKLV